MASRPQALRVYRQLMRNGRQYNDYNMREYIQRRVRDEFKANKTMSDAEQIDKCLDKARHELEVVKRQAIISRLYNHGKLIIEV
jgi:uncharacterized membrane protein